MKERGYKGIQMRPEYHLIVTEGTKTEPQYFNSVKEIVNKKYKGKIEIKIEGEGKSTLDLLEKAKEYVIESENGINHVWLVYDKDDFPKERFNLTDELCKNFSNEETTYHALWSNECIELWFLLHFIYFDSNIVRDEYIEKLTENFKLIGVGEYKKNRTDIYEILEPYQQNAINHAKRLLSTYSYYNPTEMAPMTKVYEFFEKLSVYLK